MASELAKESIAALAVSDEPAFPRAFCSDVLSEFAAVMAVDLPLVQTMIGIGTLGIGGAYGPGYAIKAGYQGNAGTVTASCQALKFLATPVAKPFKTWSGMAEAEGARLMRDVNSGPVKQPGVPMAEAPKIWIF